MIECPIHKKLYLYKEILDNGMIAIGCTAHKCEWKTPCVHRHLFEGIPTIGELREDWGGV